MGSSREFQRVQTPLHRNGRRCGPAVRDRYGTLLKRLLYCKACGKAMMHSPHGRPAGLGRSRRDPIGRGPRPPSEAGVESLTADPVSAEG